MDLFSQNEDHCVFLDSVTVANLSENDRASRRGNLPGACMIDAVHTKFDIL